MKKDIKFEEALEKLEESVKLLESGNMSLDESIKVFEEAGKEKYLKYPDMLPETMRGLSDFKSNLLATAVANYYCYAAFTSCVGPVDQENPSELYLSFKEQMGSLPLQPNMESYMNEFLSIAEQNQVAVDPEMLANVEFMPKPEQAQNVDPAQGSAQ